MTFSFKICAGFFCLSSLIIACQGAPKVDLYSVGEVSPDVVEPGDVLKVAGKGFVEGPAEVVLSGEFKPDGLKESRSKDVALRGKAVSEKLIEVPIKAYTMDRIAKEAVGFTGVVVVSFPSALQETAIRLEAESPELALRFQPSGGGVKAHAAKVREAVETMRLLGIAMDVENQDAVQVVDVKSGSLAARSGVDLGFKLLSVDGFPLSSPSELSGLDLASEHRFEFVSDLGEVATVRGMLLETPPFQKDEFLAVVLTSVALGLFLALILPTFLRKTATPSTGPINPVSHVLGFAGGAALALVFPALVMVWRLDVDGTVWLAGLFLGAAAVLLVYSPQNLIPRIFNVAGAVLGFAMIILMGGASGNSLGLSEVVATQSGAHFALHIWRNPLMMVATVMAISILWPSQLLGKNPSPLVQLVGWVFCVAGAMAVVFFCLGGWLVPGVVSKSAPAHSWEIIFAVAVFAMKTWFVAVAARAMAGADRTDRRAGSRGRSDLNLRWLPMCILGILAVGVELLNVQRDLYFAGQVVSAGVFFTLLSLFIFSKVVVYRARVRPPQRSLS